MALKPEQLAELGTLNSVVAVTTGALNSTREPTNGGNPWITEPNREQLNEVLSQTLVRIGEIIGV